MKTVFYFYLKTESTFYLTQYMQDILVWLCNQYTIMNEIFYLFFLFYQIRCVFHIYSTSYFRPTTFQGLTQPWWLVPRTRPSWQEIPSKSARLGYQAKAGGVTCSVHLHLWCLDGATDAQAIFTGWITLRATNWLRVTDRLCAGPRSPASLFKKLIICGCAELRCRPQAFSSCGERGLLSVAARGRLIAVASLVAEHRF